MIINTNGLMKAMKAARSKEGYIVALDGSIFPEKLILQGPDWTAVCDMQSVPRKVLSLIVEHLGHMPKAGYAWRVQKRDVQTEIFETVQEIVEDLTIDGAEAQAMRRTILTAWGCDIWQSKSQAIVAISPDLADIADIKGDVMLYDNRVIAIRGSMSEVYLKAVRYGEDLQYIGYLEHQEWPTR